MNNDQQYIYIVLLENNRYFMHHTYKKNYDQVLFEFEIYYDYLKLYKPIRILDMILEKDDLHLDTVVKEYMYNYGYEYVRGGSYTNVELTPNEETFILRELTETVRENAHIISYQTLLDKYVNREWKSVEEYEEEYRLLKTEYAKYQQEKMKRDEIEVYDTNKTITNYMIEEIENLRDFCKTRGTDHTKVTKKYVELYHKILPKIKHIIQKYTELSELYVPPKYEKYLNLFPHFFMDPFFYTYSFSPCPECVTNATEIDRFFEAILFFTQWILCRIQELKFDVNTYYYDIEWLYPRIFYVLENKKTNLQLVTRN
jgi:hypothetical protein